MPDSDLPTFTALIGYLFSDAVELGDGADAPQRALRLMQLARKYQVRRLELLCAQALQERVAASWTGRPRRASIW